MNHHAMLRHNVFHRRLERTEPVYTVFFFAFGAAILFVSCSMSRNYRRAQREEAARLEEEERLEEEKTFKLVEKRRAQLRNAFLRKDLAKVSEVM